MAKENANKAAADAKEAKRPWSQRTVEFGDTLMARMVAKQEEIGILNFAEFVRHVAADYLTRHGDAKGYAVPDPAAGEQEPEAAAAAG